MKLIKSYNFWVRLVAVFVLLVRVVGAEFGVTIDSGLIMDIATVVASILVVLGVIQAPSEQNNNNGGSIMKTMEQIKEDITKVKEKLVEKFGNSDGVVEISTILDNIFGEEKQQDSEAVIVEVGEVAEEVRVVGDVSEVQIDNVVTEEEKALIQSEIIEAGEEIQADLMSEQNISEGLSENEQARLNEVLKAKILEVITRDMDEIISEVVK